jgi:hypothetical protein
MGDLESAKDFIKIGKENGVAQNLVNSFLMNPRGDEVVTFEEKKESFG